MPVIFLVYVTFSYHKYPTHGLMLMNIIVAIAYFHFAKFRAFFSGSKFFFTPLVSLACCQNISLFVFH